MPTDPDLARYAMASFAHLIERGERISPAGLADRIAEHYDAGNPKTAAVIAAIRALPADLVLVGQRSGAYRGQRHLGNIATLTQEIAR